MPREISARELDTIQEVLWPMHVDEMEFFMKDSNSTYLITQNKGCRIQYEATQHDKNNNLRADVEIFEHSSLTAIVRIARYLMEVKEQMKTFGFEITKEGLDQDGEGTFIVEGLKSVEPGMLRSELEGLKRIFKTRDRLVLDMKLEGIRWAND